MGMKKSCSCGYWNQEQQECLYDGSACIRDDQKVTVTKEFMEKWAGKLEEVQWCGEQPAVTFLMAYIYEIKQMLKEAGVKVLID